jgi:nucleoside-diphosphate-sugar epimerase
MVGCFSPPPEVPHKVARSAGKPVSIASTCALCPAGCGILGEVLDGRLIKIVGNPKHPNNRGKICSRGYAGITVLYDPDRLLYPLAGVIIFVTLVNPFAYQKSNLEGFLNLLELAKRQGVERFVHTSTSETYGTAQYTPIDEKHPLKGQSPYAASKIGADKLAESYHLSFGVPVATIRPFNTYGPRQSARAVIPTIISQALSGEVIRLGSLSPVRDLNYVGDTVEGFIKVAENSRAVGEVINLGSGKSVSIGELAEKIVGLLGGGKQIVTAEERLRPEGSEVLELLCDNRKARELLRWGPQVSLDEGLARTMRFIEGNLSRYKPEIYNV